MVTELISNQLIFVSALVAIPLVVGPPAVIVLFFLVKHKKYSEIPVLVGVLCSYFLNVLLKLTFKHTRPETAGDQFLFDQYSFPSGHVLVYTVFFGYLFLLTYKYPKVDKIVRVVLRIASSYFIVFVGISRMYLGEHWLTDVVGGYLIGLGYLLFLWFLSGYKRHLKR